MADAKFAIDLITFFDPGYWGTTTTDEVVALGAANPRPFWDRMLDALSGLGIAGIETTFAPFDWETAIDAYGSIERLTGELRCRGLSIATGFFANVAIDGHIPQSDAEAAHFEYAERFADFLASTGVDVMVMGLPMRASWDTRPPLVIDLTYASRLADFCNRLGAKLLERGVQLALHPEAHSVFSTPRDIDLLLLLTDPIYVGFCPDTAHILLSGGDPVEVVARHQDRVIATHWKDAIGPAPLRITIDADVHVSHRRYFTSIGSGRVDWSRWTRLLEQKGFDGWSVLEIDAVPDPVREIASSMRYIRSLQPTMQ